MTTQYQTRVHKIAKFLLFSSNFLAHLSLTVLKANQSNWQNM